MEKVEFYMHFMECDTNVTPHSLQFPQNAPVALTKPFYEPYKQLARDCFRKMREGLNIKPYDAHDRSLADFDELNQNTFLLMQDEELIGAITCAGDSITNVLVSPAHQGKGHGRELMEFAMAHMQKRGINPIKLTVTKWNMSAVILYEKLGFKIVKTTLVKGENVMDEDGGWRFNFTEEAAGVR